MSRIFLAVLLFGLVHLSLAQFQGFFNGMFGQHQQPQQPSSGQWLAFADSTSCTTYLCPDTMQCAARPSDCPCPNVEDVKCLVPDTQEGEGTVVCVRGGVDCAQVEKLARKFT
ncbi:hypothetical protein K488DRAFT_46309 [Vararia minispora EC-137]|uniref:Uncharacterized protein n=1 Tax=Vararia minispora EC-137 TaxID=1314806 RepID=A0ACB8QQK2_9AGAM|nr:hypothetical protein K488DRAFT_46309 [Vararia minispora EC-137]